MEYTVKALAELAGVLRARGFADIAVDTAGQTVEECAEAILEVVRERIAYR